MSRIKKNYVKTGRGDTLYSEFTEGELTHKSDPANIVYGKIEEFKLHISSVQFFMPEQLDEYDMYIFNYLSQNLYSIGSFCYLKGKTEKHNIDPELLASIAQRIATLEAYINEHCKDFIIAQDLRIIEIERLRVSVRALELSFATWHAKYFGTQPPEGNRLNIAALLNRLSTYFFWLTRYYTVKFELTETHWLPKMDKFEPPSYNLNHEQTNSK
jgi:cob(I)alamin adenosyltransferase